MSKIIHQKELQRNILMYLSRYFNRSFAVPDRVSVNLTLRCNLSCVMCTTCYSSPELSLEEIFSIVDQTAKMGIEVFNPLGGEPFMRGDIEDILSYAVQKGFFVSLTTNGTLITERRAERISKIPVDRLHFNFSLDGNQKSNDFVRGEGNFERAIQGYIRLRQADMSQGNSRRKILSNTILHAQNLYDFEDILEQQKQLGFDGVQILNLFRSEDMQMQKSHEKKLWFQKDDFRELESLCERLAQRVERDDMSGFRIQNSAQELRKIPSYYRDELTPLEAPCWAGWKELYINADGQAIMCDGTLDFLQGSFGNIRESSLTELWNSEELRQRRDVVKKCKTPCVQNCYLRQDSDSLIDISQKTWDYTRPYIQSKFLSIIPSFSPLKRIKTYRDTDIRIELSDVSHCDSEGTHTNKWIQLTSHCSQWPTAENWKTLQERKEVSFDRGFMGFEVVQKLVQDIERHQYRFGKIILGWRGEPLLHPEFERIFTYLTTLCQRGIFGGIRVETSTAFLSETKARLSSVPIKQEWCIDLDKSRDMSDRGLIFLEKYRSSKCHIILKRTARKGWKPAIDILRYPHYSTFFGDPPPENFRNALWFSRWDGQNFWADQKADQDLQELAQQVGSDWENIQIQKPRSCKAPQKNVVLSWDGKMTLCIRDVQLQNTIGEINHHSFVDLFEYQQRNPAKQAMQQGIPQRDFCRDCGFPWSPNHPS